MPQRMTTREVAGMADTCSRLLGFEIEVEYTKNGRLHLLKQITFGRTPSGRPSKKTMECFDDGKERAYDKNYDFQATASIIPEFGKRHPLKDD